MLMSPSFDARCKTTVGNSFDLARSGVVSKVSIPLALLSSMTYDVNIEDGAIVFSKGESFYILTDEFGLVNNGGGVDMDIFFIEGGVFIELIAGKIVMKDTSGNPYLIDNSGHTSLLTTTSKVVWTTAANLKEKADLVIGYRYGATKEQAGTYVDNLLLSCTFYCSSNGYEPCMSVTFVTQYEDLGCGQFEFTNYNSLRAFAREFNKAQDNDDSLSPVDVADLEHINDEPEEEEIVMDFEDED